MPPTESSEQVHNPSTSHPASPPPEPNLAATELEHSHGKDTAVTMEHTEAAPKDSAAIPSESSAQSAGKEPEKLSIDTTSHVAQSSETKDEGSEVKDAEKKSNDDVDPEKEALKSEMEMEDNPVPGEQAQSDENAHDSQSEIQSIMEQFDEGMDGPGAEEIMSPRLEIAGPRGSPMVGHPPRKSSLEPLASGSQVSLHHEVSTPPAPPRTSSLLSTNSGLGISQTSTREIPESPESQRQPALPPRPDPDPDLPFDFHRFLEQLRHRTADPVAKFLRSFLQEFGKKQWMVHEQVKIISDFLEFISKKMAQCEIWRSVSDPEFDNACEGMEKLVMNRLYSQTFSPAIPPPDPSLMVSRSKRRLGVPPPGRRGQHQEDVERDDILAQKVRIYSWVREEHLDIKPLNEKGKKFLVLAQQGSFDDSRVTFPSLTFV
jgi:hypothetical protein